VVNPRRHFKVHWEALEANIAEPRNRNRDFVTFEASMGSLASA